VRAAPLNEPPPASRNGSSDADNTQFLSDEFGIPESKAASAVAGPGASEAEVADLAADVHQRRSEEDPLAGIPTLESSDDFTADADETRLKPVIGRTNNRTGAG
jgi:ATP-dependent Clp protease ATP-binding subunit ClpA